jgi:hypothetical protein
MEKTKRFLVVLMVVALAVPAAANLRMARKVDGVISGSLKAVPAAAKLRLMAERLEAVFPELDLSYTDYKSPVRFRAVYEIENQGSAPAAVPLRFLAVDIAGLSVELNGKGVSAVVKQAPEETAECVVLMAKHRSGFLPGFYKDFLGRLRTFVEKDAGGPVWSEAFVRTLEEVKADEPAAADFEVVLPPGRSRLVVQYGQRMFIDERGNGYFAAWPKKGVTGFDYLLYPAKAWPTDPGFKLTVLVSVPDARAKKLFFRVRRGPTVKCNLALTESLAGDGNGNRLFEGEFGGDMPADVLTFLIWFDEGAAAYVR